MPHQAVSRIHKMLRTRTRRPRMRPVLAAPVHAKAPEEERTLCGHDTHGWFHADQQFEATHPLMQCRQRQVALEQP